MNSNILALYEQSDYVQVEYYADLDTLDANIGDVVLVQKQSGTFVLGTRKQSGLYIKTADLWQGINKFPDGVAKEEDLSALSTRVQSIEDKPSNIRRLGFFEFSYLLLDRENEYFIRRLSDGKEVKMASLTAGNNTIISQTALNSLAF